MGKIASDLRLLSMGPRAGIAEIRLPAVQPGSSIMPGKVNPSMPEMVNQVCYQVMGCDATIATAAEAGQLELNVMMPVIAWNALHASTILTHALDRAPRANHRGPRSGRGAVPRAPRSQHGGGHRAQPLHRLCGDRRDREGVRRHGRSIREMVLERELMPADGSTAILSAEAMTQPGVPAGAGRSDGCGRAAAERWPRPSAGVAEPAARRPGAPHAACSRPKTWGMLEGPDRDAWQKPDQVMDALGIGERSVVADLGAGGGWFTVRLARRVGPNGTVFAQDIQQQMIERSIGASSEKASGTSCTSRHGSTRGCRQAGSSRPHRRRVSRGREAVALLRNVGAALKPGGRSASSNLRGRRRPGPDRSAKE